MNDGRVRDWLHVTPWPKDDDSDTVTLAVRDPGVLLEDVESDAVREFFDLVIVRSLVYVCEWVRMSETLSDTSALPV